MKRKENEKREVERKERGGTEIKRPPSVGNEILIDISKGQRKAGSTRRWLLNI